MLGNTISCNLGNNKKNYVVRRDRHIEVVVDIMNLKGLHSATIIWYQPDGHIFSVCRWKNHKAGLFYGTDYKYYK